jgi:hypothetical protein
MYPQYNNNMIIKKEKEIKDNFPISSEFQMPVTKAHIV